MTSSNEPGGREVARNIRREAADEIRSALVPLHAIADLLRRPGELSSREWCSWMLDLQLRRISEILDGL
jgi:hypothetical protein